MIELYKSFNIYPTKVLGHSAGELAAFYCSGALNMEDCIKISYYRSILQQKTAGDGNMLVVNISEEDYFNFVESSEMELLEIACINDYNSIVLSGNSETIEAQSKFFHQNNIFNVKIRGNCPFHSSFQDKIMKDVLDFSKDIKIKNPTISLFSSVTGKEVNISNYSNDYWWKNIRERVNFLEGMNNLKDTNIFIEIGPHPVLSSNIKNILGEVEILYSDNRKENSSIRLLSTIADLWSFGYRIKNNFGIKNNKYILNHVWEKNTDFINESEFSYERRNGIYNNNNLLKFSKNEFSYVKDHIINKKFILPTVFYIDIINRFFTSSKYLKITDFKIKNMYTDDKIQFNVQNYNNELILNSVDSNVNYFSCNYEEIQYFEEKIDVDNLLKNSIKEINKKNVYKILDSKKLNFGSELKSINKCNLGSYWIICELELNKNKNFKINPTYIDSCLTSSLVYNGYTNFFTYLPSSIDSIEQILNSEAEPRYVYSEILEVNYENMIQNSFLLDEYGNVICKMKNIRSNNLTKELSLERKYELTYKLADKTEGAITTNFNICIIENDNIIELKNRINSFDDKTYFILKNDHNGIIYGFLKSYQNEKNKDSIIIISDDINSVLVKEIVNNKFEKSNEYKILDNRVYYPELVKFTNNAIVSKNFYFNIEKKGDLNSLGFFPNMSEKLKDNHVSIRVKASSLNFKDLMVSLNIVDSQYIGYEFSGIVEESNSPDFKKGDIVFGTPNKSGKGISNFIDCHSKYLFKAPVNLNFIESASIGLIFGTSYLALIERANIKKGDYVLIHSAMGGIGQACIRICKMIGAHVIASVGTENKVIKLKDLYEIEMITNSRVPEKFKEDVLKYTNNKGVDVIINSLSGDALQTNFEIVSKNGVIVEIGKKDILNKAKIPINRFIDSITYTSVHFDELLESHNSFIKNIMNKVVLLFENHNLIPTEISKYHISEAKNMINYMKKGEHTGKLILEVDGWIPTELKYPTKLFYEDKYYLITGGTGGLGIELVKWMFNKGAKKFILISRSNLIDKKAQSIIENIKMYGGVVITESIDVCDKNKLLEYFNDKDFEVDGIFHLAGVIKDKIIDDMSEEDINLVLKPKVNGANNLDLLSRKYNLTYFVLFSSISALIGNIGQANYSAANSYLDYLAQIRKKENLPALSINVGAISGAGMIDDKIFTIMKSNNLDLIHYFEFFENMGTILQDNRISNICISNQNWFSLHNKYPHIKMFDLFKSDNIKKIENQFDIKDRIIKKIKSILEIDEIDTSVNLNNYGVDSILAMEISSWLKEEAGMDINQIDIIQGISIDFLVSKFDGCEVKINKEIAEENKVILRPIFKKRIKEVPDFKNKFNEENYSNYYLFLFFLIIFIYYFWL